ncbi:hypothetical protein CHS0354_004544 [Potamilus streckersoni]|uniref:Uncharacterized protein n=1 Tax=Potamilus streckersoni TaxID=2493646 RepID=A0AAE0S5K1_9BIVA|nr:hypothetical protein CHS0354_004544 [Potamilus streckersoni]
MREAIDHKVTKHVNMAKWLLHMLIFSFSDMQPMTYASPTCDTNVRDCLKSYSSMMANVIIQSTITLHLNMYGNVTMDFLNPIHVWRRLCSDPDMEKTMSCAVNGLKACDIFTLKNLDIPRDHINILETLSVNATAAVTDTLKCNQYQSLEMDVSCADHVINPGQLFHCPNLNQVRLSKECNPEASIWICSISILDQVCPNLVDIYLHTLQLISHHTCKFDSCLIKHHKCEEMYRSDQPVFNVPDAKDNFFLIAQKLVYLCGSGRKVVQCMSEGIKGCPIYQKYSPHQNSLVYLQNDVLDDLLVVGCDDISALTSKMDCLNTTLNGEDFINCYRTNIGKYPSSVSEQTNCSVNRAAAWCTSNTVGVKCGWEASDFLNKWQRVFFTLEESCLLPLRGSAFVNLPIYIFLFILTIVSLAVFPGNTIFSFEFLL